MPVTGNQEPRKLLSINLDKDALLLLARDLLFVRGHDQIRITNGPGDGQRDLHSLRNGEPYITQCKFHMNDTKAVSSLDIAELPLALVKFGANDGLFITNARLSPQAKREMLNDFENLNLEFLDGDTLALEVLEHPLLKEAWFDGTAIEWYQRSISFPLLVRLHDNDLPFDVLNNDDKIQEFKLAMKAHFPDLVATISRGVRTVEDFHPYRLPSFPTMEEGMGIWIRTTEIVLDGRLSLADIDWVRQRIARLLVGLAHEAARLTIVMGRPSLATHDAPHTPCAIKLAPNAANFVKTKVVCAAEVDFFSANTESIFWTAINDARVSEAEWIRLYSSRINCALKYEMLYPLAIETDPSKILHTTSRRFGWQYSVHALLPRWDKWPHKDLPEPDEKIDWYEEKVLCAWLHHLLLGGPIRLPSWTQPIHPLAFPSSRDSVKKLKDIRARLICLSDVELLKPEKARHMLAVLGNDVYGDTFTLKYSTGEMLHYLHEAKSPLRPINRIFAATFVWHIDSSAIALDELDCDKVIDLVDLSVQFSLDVDFLIASIDIQVEGLQDETTALVLSKVHSALDNWVIQFEEILQNLSIAFKRSTSEFWRSKYAVSLGVDHSDSGKIYFSDNPGDVGLSFLADQI